MQTIESPGAGTPARQGDIAPVFVSEPSIAETVPPMLVEPCLGLFRKNIELRDARVESEEARSSITIASDSLSEKNREIALWYGDEVPSADDRVISLLFPHYEDATPEESHRDVMRAVSRFDRQSADWITPIPDAQIIRETRRAGIGEDSYIAVRGWYRASDGSVYASRQLYEKRFGSADPDPGDISFLPGYFSLSMEARRLLARQWTLYRKLSKLPLSTVTEMREKIGLKLLAK